MDALNILQLSDLHIQAHADDTMLGIDTEYYFRRTLQQAHDQHGPFDIILLTGDLAQDPHLATYRRIDHALQSYRTPCLCLPGNHDDFNAMQAVFRNDLIRCDKHRLLPGWQIIALNSQKPGSPVGLLADDELAFLKKILQCQPTLPTLIAMHHPCVPSGSPWLDTMQIENSGAIIELLHDFDNVKAIICGHIHQELSVLLAGKVPVYATPSTCFQFTPDSQEFSIADSSPGYRVLKLAADGNLFTACYRIPEPLSALDKNAHGY